MIVRILGEGQYRLPDSAADTLNAIDGRVEQAVDAGDEASFAAALDELVAAIRSQGTVIPNDEIVPSDAVVPDPDSTLEEVQRLLGEEGLIPD